MSDIQLSEKQCTKCGETKPLSGFYKQKNTPDGRTYHCADCVKENTKRYNERKRQEMGEEAYLEWRSAMTAKHRDTKEGRRKARLHTKATRLAEHDLKELHPKQYRTLLDKHRYELGLTE